jgi:SAM-dependent methyltransferase
MTPAVQGVEVCPVCQAAPPAVYLDGPEQPLEVESIGSSRRHVGPGTILRCTACHFAFRRMRSATEELAGLYRQMDTTAYEAERFGRERTAHRHLEIVHQHVRGERLLDVGCASGVFLSQMVEAGWKATGVEPSETLCALARKRLQGRATLHCAVLEEAQVETGFDAITLWDVLEHVPDPLAFLVACRRLLHPGGFLFLNVPDLDSVQARLLGRRWPLLLPEHLNYFNRPSLLLCGKKAGLQILCFGRRRAWFSLGYIASRVAQHDVPASSMLRRLTAGRLGQVTVPIAMGESYAVCRC